jgi:hypothetical protein
METKLQRGSKQFNATKCTNKNMTATLHTDDTSHLAEISDVDTPATATALPQVSDMSPLIYDDKQLPSVDNAATMSETEVIPVRTQNAVAMSSQSSTGKKLKGFSIVAFPRDSMTKETRMRQLSAAEERQIDKAIELANSFARLNANEHTLLTSHSPSGSSKESLNSPGHNYAHTFRFSAFKRRAERAVATSGILRDEKKPFIDGLRLTCDTTAIFTPDAQAAYNELVAMSSPTAACEAIATKFTTKLPSGRHFRTHHLRSDSPAPRPSLVRRLKRCSLSESDQGLILPTAIADKHKHYHTKHTCHVSTQKESETGALQQHRIELQSISSTDATMLSTNESNFVRNNDNAHSPPPALPPRIPHRSSTVNSKPWQRQYSLTKKMLYVSPASKGHFPKEPMTYNVMKFKT